MIVDSIQATQECEALKRVIRTVTDDEYERVKTCVFLQDVDLVDYIKNINLYRETLLIGLVYKIRKGKHTRSGNGKGGNESLSEKMGKELCKGMKYARMAGGFVDIYSEIYDIDPGVAIAITDGESGISKTTLFKFAKMDKQEKDAFINAIRCGNGKGYKPGGKTMDAALKALRKRRKAVREAIKTIHETGKEEVRTEEHFMVDIENAIDMFLDSLRAVVATDADVIRAKGGDNVTKNVTELVTSKIEEVMRLNER